MSDLIKGVDVASYQSSTYSLDGLDFVFVKATQSTNYVNPRLPAQAARAREAGLVVGFYHFLVRGNIKEQAAYFLNKAGARPGEILACDWENNTDGTFPSNAEKDMFIRELKRLAPGRRVVLYCNRSFWTDHDSTNYAGDGLWIADPNHPAGHPSISSAWLFDQYSSAGGIDHNVANFPTRAALRKWAGVVEQPPKPAPAPAPPTGDTDMSLTADQTFAAVWKTDAVKAPDDAPDKTTNATWAAQSYLRSTYQEVRALRAGLAAVAAQAAANGEALTRALGALEALAGAVGSLDVAGAPGALRSALDGATLTVHTEGQPQ